MTRPSDRPQLRRGDFGEAAGLRRPLNDALAQLADRLAALETSAAIVAPVGPIELVVGATSTVGNSPFPVSITLPESPRAVVGLIVLRCENTTTLGISGMAVSAHGCEWEAPGDGTLVLQYITGFQANKTYKVTLGVVYGG